MDDIPEARQFLSVSSGDFTFDLGTDSFGHPFASVSDYLGSAEIVPEDVLFPGVYNPVIVSVYPDYENEILTVSWFHEGVFSEASAEGWTPGPLGAGDTTLTRIGGEAGGPDLIDELGIYYLDSRGLGFPVADLYARNAEYIHDGALIFADGFDSPEPDYELNTDAWYPGAGISRRYSVLEISSGHNPVSSSYGYGKRCLSSVFKYGC